MLLQLCQLFAGLMVDEILNERRSPRAAAAGNECNLNRGYCARLA
jgi:hypothetical protein